MSENDGAPRRLDLLGLKCPLPALKTARALAAAAPGDLIEVLSDDPLAPLDMANLARETGDELLVSEAAERGWRFLIRRVGRAEE